MGWCYGPREKGLTTKEWFAQEFPEASKKVVDMATKNGTIYAALQVKEDEVICLVIKTAWARNSYYNFGYKDMDEFMGPGESECPEKIFKLLTPRECPPDADGGELWSKQWRERCAANIEKQKEAKKVKAGMKVKFAHPIRFSNGAVLDTFTFDKRNTFRSDLGGRYTITDWRKREYEIAS